MSALNRNVPPSARQVRAFSFPAFSSQELPHGLQVLVAPLPRTPLVHLGLLIRAGGQCDPAERPGLASLTGAMLDEGTASRSSPEIAQHVERLGGFLATGADWNVAYAEIDLLAKYSAQGLELLTELVTKPTFPTDEIQRLARERLAELTRGRDDPGVLSERAFYRTVYQGSVYSNPLIGTHESLRLIQRVNCLEFYAQHFLARGSALLAVGDVDPEKIFSQAEQILNSPNPKFTAAETPTIEPHRADGVRVYIVDRPAAVQTELRIGHSSVARLHPDRIPLRILNSVLGGKFTSRINLNLRERHGFTYGAHSRFVERRGPGPFVVGAAVGTEVAGKAVDQILAELKRIRDGVSDAELTDAKNYLLGVFPYTLQSVDGISRRLEELAVYELPEDFFATYPSKVEAVTREDILRAAQDHVDPQRLVIVAVGPAQSLRPQLASVAEAEVLDP